MAQRTKQEEIEALRMDVARLQVFERLWLLQHGQPQPEMAYCFVAHVHSDRAQQIFVHVYGVGTCHEVVEMSERELGATYPPIVRRPERFDDLLKFWGASHMPDFRRASQELRARHRSMIQQIERCAIPGHSQDREGLCLSCGVVLNLDLAEVAACERVEVIRLNDPTVAS